MLLWPALWNGYPLVFSDTGTYLSQAIERYLGWDRPVFYSLFLFSLHMTITTWPVIVVQALLVTHTLHLLRRALLPQVSGWWLLPWRWVSVGCNCPALVRRAAHAGHLYPDSGARSWRFWCSFPSDCRIGNASGW